MWDVTVVSTLAQSYVDRAATDVESAAEITVERKLTKYTRLSSNSAFQPDHTDLISYVLMRCFGTINTQTNESVDRVSALERHNDNDNDK